MLKKWIAYILLPALFICCKPATAQNRDSLLRIINTTTNDSVSALAYYELIEKYKNDKPDSSVYYNTLGLKYFTDKGNKSGIAAMLWQKARIDKKAGATSLALIELGKALKTYEEIGDSLGIYKCLQMKGFLVAEKGNYAEAVNYLLRTLIYADKTNNTSLKYLCLLNLGAANEELGNLDIALKYYNTMMQQPVTNWGDRVNKTYLYNNIGVIFAKKENYKLAIRYFNKALDSSENNDRYTECKILAYTNIGHTYMEMKEQQTSLKYMEQALLLTQQQKMPIRYSQILLLMGNIYRDTDPKKTMQYFEAALDTLNAIGCSNKTKTDLLYNMQDVQSTLGNYKEAYLLLTELKAIEDSVSNYKEIAEINNTQSFYELQLANSKIKELELIRKKEKLRYTSILTLSVAIFAILTLTILLYLRSKRFNEKLSKNYEEIKKANSTKDKLFSIIGHDLRGPVGNSIMVLDIIADPARTNVERKLIIDTLKSSMTACYETLEKLLAWGNLLLKGYNYSPDTFSPCKLIKKNIDLLEVVADQKKISLQCDIPSTTLLFGDPNHFDFIIRNLVSNAIKFTRKNGWVKLGVSDKGENGYITFLIEDNGVGIDMALAERIFQPDNKSTNGTENESGSSIGLMLCREFVAQNDGKIWVESEKGVGSRFYFSLKTGQPVT
jgi:signal transduction histidine kinase